MGYMELKTKIYSIDLMGGEEAKRFYKFSL
jgi:hypothetical protein